MKQNVPPSISRYFSKLGSTGGRACTDKQSQSRADNLIKARAGKLAKNKLKKSLTL